MGLFNFKKKQKTVATKSTVSPIKAKPIPEHLVDGNLPYGWIYANREFTEKVNAEYSYFLQNWLNSRQAEPIKHYGALKSFVIYMNDAKKLCYSKGECFGFWFTKVIADDDYIQKRTDELEKLEKKLGKA